MTQTEWSDEWPTTPVPHWLYGWLYKSDYDKPADYYYVKVWQTTGGSIVCIANGAFIYKSEGVVRGKWQPITFPDPPVRD